MKRSRSKLERSLKNEDPSSQVAALFDSELENVYWAEKAITIAIPEMIKDASSEAVKRSLKNHLENAMENVRQILTILGKEPVRKGDKQMSVIASEVKELWKEGTWCYERNLQTPLRREESKTRRVYNKQRLAVR